MASYKPVSCLAGILILFLHYARGETGVGYYGQYIGPLSRLNHGVTGEVYAVDARTLHIRDFTYDGEGPAAFFYAGNTKAVGPGGFFIRDETGSNGVLKRYNKKHITVTLPEGKTLNSIRWFSVWCEEFAVNFGDIQIPRGLDFPKPQKIGPLTGVHGVSSENVVIVDAQTLLIPSFSYDGEAPDAKFWVGRGPKPSPQGIRVPDENGKQTPLRRYDRKTIVLTLPGDLTIFDIGHFGVWCEAFTVDFGHVQVPASLNVPPSLKMLGVSPQSKLNCEVLSDDLAYEVRWAVAGDSIVIQLVAKLEDGEYMSFGLSGEAERSVMVGGDVVVAWVDQDTLNGFAQDYYLDAKSQCAGTHGSCPDAKIENNADSVRLLNAALVNGYSIVTFQRPLRAHDGLDRPIVTNKSQPVIWAVGPLNSKGEVSYHSITSKDDVYIDFGRPPKWNCPIPQTDTSAEGSSEEVAHREPQSQHTTKPETGIKQRTPAPPAAAPTTGAWDIPPIQCNEPDDGVFYAQMGPTGGKRGYPAITGHVGWGIAYYINGLLIPEIHVVRGKTYNFVVEGGKDNSIPAKFHPFYITDDPVGGYQHKTQEERGKVNIYAGAELNKEGEVVPTGIGRLCNWTPDPEEPSADEFASFGAYQRTLTLVCDHGEPAVVQWTPDRNTPDTVFYQCFTHRYLGWKIHVHDTCDLPSVAGSEPVPSVVLPEEELQAKPSIQVTTRVKPDFPPQSLSTGGKVKYPTKNRFPYEFMKPAVDIKRINSSDEGHVKPVKEEYEDLPETTTSKHYSKPDTSLVLAQGLPVQKPGPHMQHVQHVGGAPLRMPYGNLRPPPSRRPPQVVMVRRPVPGSQMMMKPHGNPQHVPHMGMIHHSGSQARPVIVKKPLMKLPQRPPMMQIRPGHILGSQIPQNRPIAPPKPVYIHKYKKASSGTPLMDKSKIKLQPSHMIGTNPEESAIKLPIAVNTGFNPGSLVIESGFKPIINTQQVAEERVSEVEYDEEDGNEGVIDMDAAEEQKSQTEMFEPMFIPSPLDSNTKHTKKATTEPVKKTRKPIRQVIMRRPVYEEALFRSEPEDEEAMADEKTETVYDGGIVTYDGKKVSGAPPPPPHAEPEKKGSEVLKQSPQFGRFEGDVPPPVPEKVPGDYPQLKVENATSEEEKRTRRSAHHEPGHTEPAPEPENHHHSTSLNQNPNSATALSPIFLITLASAYLALSRRN